MRTVGGLFALDRRVEVRGRELVVHGTGPAASRLLDDAEAERLHDAAARVLGLSDVEIDAPADVADDGFTELRLVDDGASRDVRLPVAAEAPDEVWDLLALLDELAR